MPRPQQRWAYRKLGRRYVRSTIFALLQSAYIVVALGLALLTLYEPMSLGEYLRLVAVGSALVFVDNLFNALRLGHLLEPVDRWYGGDHSAATTIAAWRRLASLPLDHVRDWKMSPVAFNIIPFCLFATWELDLPMYSAPALFAGAMVILLYGFLLRFFFTEMVLRPAVEDVASHLPPDVELGKAGIPLKWKLVGGLPAISIVTGVVVAGLSTTGDASLSDLGIDVLVAVGVAFTLSFELTLLMTRSILAPIQDLRRATAKVAEGNLSVRVPVTATDETGQLAQSFNQMVAGLEEREKLREALGAFVDPEIAERIIEEGTVLEGEEVEVSMLFLDIREFTAFAERSSAREVVQRLNEFYELVVPILTERHGHADKFIGDGLLGVFGVPERRSDHADCAVAAALEIARRVEERYGADLRIGIGVNSGPVVAGTIGGGGRVEYTVIGDPVNTAARVEQITRETGDTVLITEATRCLLTRPFPEFDPRPAAELKGKSERVQLYAPREVEGPVRVVEAPDPARASTG